MVSTEQGLATLGYDAIGRLSMYWLGLESDYKSVAFAGALLGLVIGLDVHVPW